MWINNLVIRQPFIAYISLKRPGDQLKNIDWITGGLICGCLLLGCGRNTEETVQAKVGERVQAFRLKHLAECRAALLRDAEKRVDSLLLLEATGTLADSLTRLKPAKPMQPPPLVPIDSLSVRPLFDPTLPPGSGN